MSTLRTLRSTTLAASVITALGICVLSTAASAASASTAAAAPSPVLSGSDLSVPVQTSNGVVDFRCADIAGAWNPATTECPPGVQQTFDQIATADVGAIERYVYGGPAELGIFVGVEYSVPETALIGVMACSIAATDATNPAATRSLWQAVTETQYPEAAPSDLDAAWSSAFSVLCPWLGTGATALTVPATPTTPTVPVTTAAVTPVNVVTIAAPVGYPTGAVVNVSSTNEGTVAYSCGDVMAYVGAAPCAADLQQVWDQIAFADAEAINEFANNPAVELGVFESLDYTIEEVASVGVLACVSAQRGLDSVGYGDAARLSFPEVTPADADVLWISALTELCAWQLS